MIMLASHLLRIVDTRWLDNTFASEVRAVSHPPK
jgi:hypothetical protein